MTSCMNAVNVISIFMRLTCVDMEEHFLFSLFIFMVTICGAGGNGSERDLLAYLFKNYSADVRPRKQPNRTVTVSLDFAMTRFENLDVRNRALTTTGWLTMEWTDDFLTWTPSDFSNITKVVIPASKVWVPDIALDNSITGIYNSAHRDLFRVAVFADGTVVWEPGGSFSTICSIGIRFYPFDHQTCDIVFANWQYTKEMVFLQNASNVINTGTFSQSGEWEVEYTQMKHSLWKDPTNPTDFYPEVIMTIHVRRKFMYYFINILVPCLMMSILILVVFHLPPDSGEKVSLGVTVLLAFSVFQLMIAENVPSSSDTIPVLEVYLIFFMGESTFSVAISVLVLNLHHRTEYKPPPAWLRKLVLDWMACILFMRRIRSTSVQPGMSNTDHKEFEDEPKRTSEPDLDQERVTANILMTEPQDTVIVPPTIKLADLDQERVTANILMTEPQDTVIVPPTIKLAESQVSNMGLDLRRQSSSRDHLSPFVAKSALKIMKSIAHMDHSPSNHSRDEFMSLIRDTYRDLCQQRQDDELDAMLENEWKRIAKVIDRFFFVVTLLIIIISSSIIFGTLPLTHHDTNISK